MSPGAKSTIVTLCAALLAVGGLAGCNNQKPSTTPSPQNSMMEQVPTPSDGSMLESSPSASVDSMMEEGPSPSDDSMMEDGSSGSDDSMMDASPSS